MTKYFTNNFSIINLHKKPSTKSEIVTQMIYGDSFLIIKKMKNWLKVRIKEDNYKGFIKKKNFINYIKSTHKISSLKAKVYKFPNKQKKVNDLTFGSKIRVTEKKSNFFKFSKGWVYYKDVKIMTYKDRNLFKRINIFRNVNYKWGGKSYKGIDCSALIQICLNFNNRFCPRDAKDQFIYLKKNIKLKKIKQNDIIFWRGHVAVALNNKKLIHAYGPMKKTVIMGINQTIQKISRSAKLEIIGIKRL